MAKDLLEYTGNTMSLNQMITAHTAKGEKMNIADDLVSAFNDGYRQGREDAVVRGEWICNPDDKKFSLVCSVCGQVMPFIPEYLPDNPPFCNCGADMRKARVAHEAYLHSTRSVAGGKRTWRKLRRLLKDCYTSTQIARFTARYTPQGFCMIV